MNALDAVLESIIHRTRSQVPLIEEEWPSGHSLTWHVFFAWSELKKIPVATHAEWLVLLGRFERLVSP